MGATVVVAAVVVYSVVVETNVVVDTRVSLFDGSLVCWSQHQTK